MIFAVAVIQVSPWDSTEIEDLYLPYKPKRVTKAEIARKKGLEPLAKIIMIQNEPNLLDRVKNFIKGEVKNAAEAGVSVGNFRRTTGGKIKNGLAEMENH